MRDEASLRSQLMQAIDETLVAWDAASFTVDPAP
jgi:hypothetical protein